MKDKVIAVIERSVAQLAGQGRAPADLPVIVEQPKEEAFGDFTTNAAMSAASRMRLPPREMASRLVEAMGDGGGLFSSVEIAGPGFINMVVAKEHWRRTLREADRQGEKYGNVDLGKGVAVQVEFVSANPTGPLHVGHGRGAAVGDVLANLLRAAGFKVTKEYYINDAGRQMDLLGRSVLARYGEILGVETCLPEDGYRGDYIIDVAKDLVLKKGRALLDAPPEEAAAQATLFAKGWILNGIKKDLTDFGVAFDVWTSENELLLRHPLAELMSELEAKGMAYRSEGALWLKTTAFGDDKDRVLIRGNGQATYFANDILYHREKYRRGFDRVIDIWGADHHGYVDRMRAAVQTLGRSPDDIRVILVQLVRLLRRGEVVRMTTRGGEFDTLRQVLDEVGRDAARFFFLLRKADAQLDFDLELAVRHSSENPVYYVQYAHARVRSIFKKLNESGVVLPSPSDADLARLDLPEELALVKKIALYPDTVADAAAGIEPHRLAFFLQDTASRFHNYYNHHRVISGDQELTAARLFLIRMVGRIIAHGLGILGVTAPESM